MKKVEVIQTGLTCKLYNEGTPIELTEMKVQVLSKKKKWIDVDSNPIMRIVKK